MNVEKGFQAILETNADRKWIRAEHEILEADFDGEIVLLDMISAQYFTLNTTAAVVWRKLRQACSSTDLLAALLSQFDVTDQDLRGDVKGILSELLKEGLIREVQSEPCESII